MKSLAIRVPLNRAEQIRKKLSHQNLVNKNCKIKKDSNFLIIPIIQFLKIEDMEIIEREFEEKKKILKNYKEIVDIPIELKSLLPTSFDNIGKITILKLLDELLPYSKKIGEALLERKNIKSVAIDKGVKGESRIRDLKIIAGSKDTETIHKENGLFFKLDISKVYFSPRLATERAKIQKKVRENEIIIDMFAGVGPFSILIAKKSKSKIIYAIDINQEAMKYLKENIQKNKVKNIVPICADAKDAINKIKKADRIIMNLPHLAFDYFEDALIALKKTGTIHYYEIFEKENIGKRISDLKKKALENDYEIVKVDKRIVKTYSSTKVHIASDLKLKSVN